MPRIAAFSPAAFLLLAVACLGGMPAQAPVTPGKDFAWVRPVNDYEQKFREARTLAEQIMRHPVCRQQFKQLPDWPAGRVPTEIIWNQSLSRTVRAFTDMADGKIYLLVQTLRSSSVEYMARTLIHEMGHVASKSDYERIKELDEERDVAEINKIKSENETLVRRVTGICMRAAGIA